MTRLVEALKKVGQTFKLFQKGEIGPCDSTPSAVQVPNLVPSTFCRVPTTAQVPVEEAPFEEEGAVPEVEGAIVKEPEEIDPSAPDLQIDPTDERVDVRAKFALKRMVNSNDPNMRRDAARLILGLKGKRLERIPSMGKPYERVSGKPLAGIFGDDLGVAVKVARAHSTERWLLVPKGEDAALVLVNEGHDKDPLNDPPTVIFRGDTPDISKQPGRLEKALQEASTTFALFQDDKLVLCASSPSAKPVSNLVPSSYCQLTKLIQPLLLRWPLIMADLLPPDTRLQLRGPDIPTQEKLVAVSSRSTGEIEVIFEEYSVDTPCTLTASNSNSNLVLWKDQIVGNAGQPEIWNAELSELIAEADIPPSLKPPVILLTTETVEEGLPSAIVAMI